VKQVAATILGQAYVLGCPEGSEAQLQAAVELVDREMSSIRDNGKIKARERIAVLAALNLAMQRVESSPSPLPSAAAPDRTASHTDETLSADEAASIDALMRRIDAALGPDGQLL
jgi:cell division protein ZapA